MKISAIYRVPLLAAALLFFTNATLAPAQTIQGKVVAVADGDTITVLDSTNTQYRIRLDGIDAPESRQAFGQRAKQSLSEMVFGQTVTVQSNKKDRYGRSVGKVLLNGRDINLAQIQAGLAWHYKQYANEQTPEDRAAYAKAEERARAARLGLWADSGAPTPPWEWRRDERDNRGRVNKPVPATVKQPVRDPLPARTSQPSAGRAYIRGPRGGCYYLSGSGRKVYVDHSLCN